MDLPTLLGAVFLGVVEGLTEFIPVSSTGHLILLVDLIGFRAPPGKSFEIVVQLGAVAAVVWAYRARLAGACLGALAGDGPDRRFLLSILVALAPAIAVGAVFYPLLRALQVPLVVALALIAGGVAILVIERTLPPVRHRDAGALPLGTALAVGLCQTVAMIPGVSRSGATIMGALLLGVERRAATEFSFFLLAPTMVAASAWSLWKNRDALVFDDLLLIAVGFAAAFAAALFVVRGLVAFVGRHGFAPFAWYRIAVGTAMLAVLALR
jgi:undecaprenyl-diphosphatase